MKIRKGYRKITIDGVLWQYRIGKDFVTAISENDDRRKGKAWKIYGGSSPDDLDRARRKQCQGITPKHIASWLRSIVV